MGKSSVRVEGTVDSKITDRIDRAGKEISKKNSKWQGSQGTELLTKPEFGSVT